MKMFNLIEMRWVCHVTSIKPLCHGATIFVMFVEVVTIFLFLFIDDPSCDHDLQAVNSDQSSKTKSCTKTTAKKSKSVSELTKSINKATEPTKTTSSTKAIKVTKPANEEVTNNRTKSTKTAEKRGEEEGKTCSTNSRH